MIAIRAFFAVDLELEVVRRIASATAAVKRDCRDAGWVVRWVPPPAWHVVTCWLGEVSAAIPPVLREELRSIAGAADPITMTARGLRAGAAVNNESVDIMVDLRDDSGAYEPLVATLRVRLEDLGFHIPAPTPLPPLVVGTVLEEGQTPLDELLADYRETDFGASTARRLVLYRSDRHAPRGDFIRLWHLGLEGPAAEGRDEEAPPSERSATEAGDAEAGELTDPQTPSPEPTPDRAPENEEQNA